MNDAHDVGFLHDQKVFAIELHLGARPLAEQDAVACLDVERNELAGFVAGAGTDGDDFAFLRLLLGGVGDDDPALGLCLGLDPADDHSVVQRPEIRLCHVCLSLERILEVPTSGLPDRLLALTYGEC